MPLVLAVSCANVYVHFYVSLWQDAFVQPYQFDPESDPEGEAPEEIQWLQQDILEWLVCLNNISLFYVLLQLLLCS